MNKFLPALLIVLAVVAGYWLLSDDGGDQDYLVDYSDDVGGSEADPDGLEAGLSAGATGPRKAPKKPKGKPYRTVDPRTLPVGTLLIRPVGPDGKLVDGTRLRMYVDSARRGGFPTRLPHRDPDTDIWDLKKVRAGKVKIWWYSDHVAREEKIVTVRADQENEVTLRVKPAGTIKYTVTTYAKTPPEKVQVELFDAKGKPVKAWYEVRTKKSLTTPRQRLKVTQGPEGHVLGLEPGTYKLKVTSTEFDEWDEAEVTVEPGQTTEVALEVRR